MTPESWRHGEIAVIGLGRSGEAASRLLRAHHARVYASDSETTPHVEEVAHALRTIGAEVSVGSHDLARITRASLVVVSPGVPPSAPPVVAALDARVPVVSEIEVALAAIPSARVIAVTGTNGKSTTTSIVGHLLKGLGQDAEVAGNIGRPLSDVALRATPPAWVALEVSSYQLHDTPSLTPIVGVLTNLSPDHLDRYASVDEYYADKARLFRNGDDRSKWVVNYDDEAAMGLAEGVAGYVLRFSAEGRLADAFLDRRHGTLILLDEPVMARSELPLLGDHNVGNALAAALAVVSADPAHSSLAALGKIAAGLRTVRPLAHRVEPVAEVHGVLWVDDSKATNVAAARVGVDSMTRPTVLLLGGRHKGESYATLSDAIRAHCKAVIAYGEAGEAIKADLDGVVPVQHVRGSFDDVIAEARARTVPGDCVLLSPACSSFDMFENYEERGTRFARLATKAGARA